MYIHKIKQTEKDYSVLYIYCTADFVFTIIVLIPLEGLLPPLLPALLPTQ